MPIWAVSCALALDLQPGDLVFSRNEFDPNGPIVAKVVEAKFERSGWISNLHLRGGRMIPTMQEHPFFEKAKGWTPAGELVEGDEIRTDNGWMIVEEVFHTGIYETVHNLRVADFHTYFVGDEEWGFGVWAHNAYRKPSQLDTPTGQGHTYRDHGTHMTPGKHEARIRFGTKGDGSPGTPPPSGKSSSFASDTKHMEAVKEAFTIARVRGYNPSTTPAGVNFKFTLREAGHTYSLDATGQLQKAVSDKVFVKLVPVQSPKGEWSWHVRTIFPTG